MKRWICMFLASALLFGFAGGAAAEEWSPDDENVMTVDLENVGVTLVLPMDYFFGCYGTVAVMASDELGYKSGVYYTFLGYAAMSQEEYDEYGYDEDYVAPLIELFCLKEGFDQTALEKAEIYKNWDDAWYLGSIDDYGFYAFIGVDMLPDGFQSPYTEEYLSFVELAYDVVESSMYYAPHNPYEDQIGTAASFNTEDLYGSPVSSSELFSQNEITLVNLWATWCPHCVGELPELANIHYQLEGIGCGVVGLLDDSYDPEAVEEAIGIIQDAGVTFPVVKMTPEMAEIFTNNGLPMSFFVNRNGVMVGTPVEGAQVDKYYEAVEDLLASGASMAVVTDSSGEAPDSRPYEAENSSDFSDQFTTWHEAMSAGDNDASEYRVVCVDESGNPVPGCKVQFCSDNTCMMGTTDANGVAVFQEAPGQYTVHLLKPPAGYAGDKTEYTTPAVYGDVTIILKAA